MSTNEDLRTRIGKLIVGPSYDPSRKIREQAVEVWTTSKGGSSSGILGGTWKPGSLLLGRPEKPAATVPSPPKAERRRGTAVEMVEGRAITPPAVPPVKVERPEWVTPGQWDKLSQWDKERLCEGAGVGFEAVRERVKYMTEEGEEVPPYTPGKVQKGRIAVSF